MCATTISDLKAGEQGRIKGFRPGDRDYRQKLLSMGLTPNTQFQVVRRAPLGDPVQIQVRNFHLSLRQSEASMLLVERT